MANAVQPAITGPDTSLAGGLLIIVTLVVANRALAESRRRLPFMRHLLGSPATILAQDGEWLAGAVNREELDSSDLDPDASPPALGRQCRHEVDAELEPRLERVGSR